MLGEITDYDVVSVIGSGSFGTCYKVQRKNDGKVFVWKAIDYGNLAEDKKEFLVTEVNLLRSVRHPNVVQYYGYIVHKESTTLYVVMEHCVNGDLAALVQTCKRNNVNIQEGFIWRLLYQLANALRALQDQGILHRDVKSANVFLDDEHNAKLGDFGLAKDTASGTGKKQLDTLQAESFVGTPGYMSPEVVKGEKYDGKSDVWSLGCVAYELCSRKVPFTGHNMRQLARHIAFGRYDPVPEHYSSELRRLIDFMLTVNSTYRPDIRAILHHPSVVSHLSICQKTPPFEQQPTQTLTEREMLLRLRELALEEKERKIKERENKLIQKPKLNFDIDSSAGLGYSPPLFKPTSAKLNPALIPRPLNFPPPQRKVRFQDKKPKLDLDDVTYKWYDIDPPERFKQIQHEFKRPLSDSGQNPIITTNSEFPVKPSSDGGGDTYQNARGKYSMKDLEKAVSDTFLNGAGGKFKTQRYFKDTGKENCIVKHTML